MQHVDLDSLARRLVVDPGVSPSVVLAVGVRVGIDWRFAVGGAGQRSASHPEPIASTTPYDLASVTKPFVASAAARLVRRRVLDWTTTLGDAVPELRDTASSSATLIELLSHRAGLDAHRSLYEPLTRGEPVAVATALRTAAEARRPECLGSQPAEGFAPLYSDLGYLLAGVALSRAAGMPLGRIVETEVSTPLGVDAAPASTWLERCRDFRASVAPTEIVPFRGGEVIGEVHDENAWAVSGLDMSGHAGLFGTAQGVLKFGMGFLDALSGHREDWLRAMEAEPLVKTRSGGTLRAGFDGRSDSGSAAGSRFGPRTFGHLGFTGTSLWCDPDAALVTVILTNRVNPTRDNIAIRSVRPALGDILFETGLALREVPSPLL